MCRFQAWMVSSTLSRKRSGQEPLFQLSFYFNMSNFYFNVNPGNTNARLFVRILMENRHIPRPWFFNASLFFIIWCLVISKSTAERVMLGAAAALGLSRRRRRGEGAYPPPPPPHPASPAEAAAVSPLPPNWPEATAQTCFQNTNQTSQPNKRRYKQKLQFTDRQTGPSW